MSDLLRWADSNAKPRQVQKKTVATIVVVRVRNVVVFGPNIESTLEKASTRPPPWPRWIKISVMSIAQASTCTAINKPIMSVTSLYFLETAALFWTISEKESALRLAPPTKAPSTSGCFISSAALSGLTLPPYCMRMAPAISP